MSIDLELIERARAALRSDRTIALRTEGIDVQTSESGALVVSGEVASIAIKRRALEVLAACPGVSALCDRLHVRPAAPMSDGEIADALCKALLDDPLFRALHVWNATGNDPQRVTGAGARGAGRIEVRVRGGVVLLAGEVPSLWHKRMAGVLAWWIAGSRDVIHGLAVVPPEPDSDGAIAEAVRLVLEKNPSVGTAQIRVHCKSALVTLDGAVPSAAERELAELDAWYVFGVVRVENQIEVRW